MGQHVNPEVTPPAHSVSEGSVRLPLTKNITRSLSCPWCQVHGFSFERYPRTWQTGIPPLPTRCVTPAYPFLKRWGILPELRRPWFDQSKEIKPFISIRSLQALLNCQEEKIKVKLQSQSHSIITCKRTVVAHSKA